MMAAREYFVACQPLKIKASTPSAVVSEALEYLIENTFNKMSYLKHLSAEPLKELHSRHDAAQLARPFRATTGLMHRSKQHLYSITLSA